MTGKISDKEPLRITQTRFNLRKASCVLEIHVNEPCSVSELREKTSKRTHVKQDTQAMN